MSVVGVALIALVIANVLAPTRPHIEIPVDPRVGREVRLVGCERGELVVPVANVWDDAQRSKVIGHIEVGPLGDRKPCEGVPVTVRGIRDDLEVYEIESIDRETRGWVGRTLIVE